MTALDYSVVEQALENHDEGFCVFDRDYTFQWLNRAAARLLQRSVEEMLGRRLFEEFPEGRDTIVWTSYERAFVTGQVQEFRVWYGPLEGWFRVRATPIDGRLIVWFRNVDEEQAAAEERDALRVSSVRSGERAERLLAVVAELSRSRTLGEVIDVVIERGFGLLGGNGGGVGFVSADGSHLEVVDLRNFGGDIRDRWLGRFPLDLDVPMMLSARLGEPLFYRTLQEVQSRFPALAGDFGEQTQAFVSLPLSITDRIIGGLVVMFDSEQTFTADEQEFMLTLAGLCAQALERARLATRERDIAVTLQRSLLPNVAPVPGIETAVRYLPGAEGTEVGGDWYDVIRLGAGRIAVAVGDVMGRGVTAAALMGQVQAALRAYAHLDMPPAEVISALDAIVSSIADGGFVTCLYGVFDPGDSTLTVANAGHLPPVVRIGHTAAAADVPAGPPLGLDIGRAGDEHVLQLSPGATVAMCTDGLAESRNRDAMAGLDILARCLLAPSDSLEQTADRVIGDLLAPASRDDAALLLIRLDPSNMAAAAPWVPLQRDPQAVSEVRNRVRGLGAAHHLGTGVTDSILLVASELVTNAIRHGRGDPLLRLRITPGRAVVEVQDSSGHLPQRRFAEADDEGGRGLELVAALSSRWGWRPLGHGKVVWAELAAAEPTGS